VRSWISSTWHLRRSSRSGKSLQSQSVNNVNTGVTFVLISWVRRFLSAGGQASNINRTLMAHLSKAIEDQHESERDREDFDEDERKYTSNRLLLVIPSSILTDVL